MNLTRERLPADPPAGPIRCRDCLRKLRDFGFAVPGAGRSWRCRRCAIRRVVAAGIAPGEARAMTAAWLWEGSK